MKRIKPGFTLAEVLITLGIIGVIAAIVMPSVMSNFTFKTVGVKLSKFAAQLEGATRPFVVQNEVFRNADDVSGFIEESFIIKSGNIGEALLDAFNAENYAVEGSGSRLPELANGDNNPAVLTLKDGTRFQAFMFADYTEDPEINVNQVGEVIWGVMFDPMVNGLPRAINRTYGFVVTELGYVYPDRAHDGCIGAIYDANFETNQRFFQDADNAFCRDGLRAGGENDNVEGEGEGNT